MGLGSRTLFVWANPGRRCAVESLRKTPYTENIVKADFFRKPALRAKSRPYHFRVAVPPEWAVGRNSYDVRGAASSPSRTALLSLNSTTLLDQIRPCSRLDDSFFLRGLRPAPQLPSFRAPASSVRSAFVLGKSWPATLPPSRKIRTGHTSHIAARISGSKGSSHLPLVR